MRCRGGHCVAEPRRLRSVAPKANSQRLAASDLTPALRRLHLTKCPDQTPARRCLVDRRLREVSVRVPQWGDSVGLLFPGGDGAGRDGRPSPRALEPASPCPRRGCSWAGSLAASL
ncbi:unnamed protein product [Rangifer tarandus platyrhynchus]|uniref:Uncharacterized protein n=2 Tax=Rangifer tarandus platyrhynchus TaxID=3082113 RepID=A0ACB0FJK5_RANTA|nr:unnamed protein product [Rangifer tarandus platyrhynchus]CAI9713245.1 unnamed protein product [Rangifer tarandus platyrhynchus]